MHVEPLSHIEPVEQSRHTLPSLAMTSGTCVPHGTLDALAHGPQHSRSAGRVVPGRLTQLVPDGHNEPAPTQVRHVGEGMGSPHATELDAAQVGQHVPSAPPVHVAPAVQPAVPNPLQVRHTWPVSSSTSGILVPHINVGELAHSAQHVRSLGRVVPGGLTQLLSVLHIVPTSVHVRHAWPSASWSGGVVAPHGTLAAVGQSGQHEPAASQSVAAGQRVPRPLHASAPKQVGGMSVPQTIISAATHSPVHAHTPDTHVKPPSHGPLQRPPQPSGAPHVALALQAGQHSQRPVSALQTSSAPAQVPPQKPPHPSGNPHAAPAGQLRTHAQMLSMQRCGGRHEGTQSQVATHAPALQTSPDAQWTPKQGFARHAPARQNRPSGHVTPSHAERGAHVRLHV